MHGTRGTHKIDRAHEMLRQDRQQIYLTRKISMGSHGWDDEELYHGITSSHGMIHDEQQLNYSKILWDSMIPDGSRTYMGQKNYSTIS